MVNVLLSKDDLTPIRESTGKTAIDNKRRK